MYNDDFLQLQGFNSCPDGRSYFRRRCALDFKSGATSAPMHKDIQLSTTMRRPEIVLLVNQGQVRDQLLEHKSFPRRSNLGMPLEVGAVLYAEQRMQQPTVANVDLW